MKPAESADSAHHEPLDPPWPTFDVALGKRLQEIRRDREKTAQQVSRASRFIGLNWGRSTVVRIESGERPVSVLELMLLTVLHGKSVEELLPGEACRLADDVLADEGVVRRALTKHPAGIRQPRAAHAIAQLPGALTKVDLSAAASLWLGADLDVVSAALAAPVEEAETKAARRLGPDLDSDDVRVGARVLWGRTLVDEREARLGDDDGSGPRARQARRGHITRALVDELRPVAQRFVALRSTDDEAGA